MFIYCWTLEKEEFYQVYVCAVLVKTCGLVGQHVGNHGYKKRKKKNWKHRDDSDSDDRRDMHDSDDRRDMHGMVKKNQTEFKFYLTEHKTEFELSSVFKLSRIT